MKQFAHSTNQLAALFRRSPAQDDEQSKQTRERIHNGACDTADNGEVTDQPHGFLRFRGKRHQPEVSSANTGGWSKLPLWADRRHRDPQIRRSVLTTPPRGSTPLHLPLKDLILSVSAPSPSVQAAIGTTVRRDQRINNG